MSVVKMAAQCERPSARRDFDWPWRPPTCRRPPVTAAHLELDHSLCFSATSMLSSGYVLGTSKNFRIMHSTNEKADVFASAGKIVQVNLPLQ